MGNCCRKKPCPEIKVDIEGNTCFDDIECSSTCCIIKKKTSSPKHRHRNKEIHPPSLQQYPPINCENVVVETRVEPSV